MLVELAKRLRSQVGDQDVLSRIGGDEFVALISGIDNNEDATVAINQLRQVFEQPFIVSTGDHLRLTASMGVSLYQMMEPMRTLYCVTPMRPCIVQK